MGLPVLRRAAALALAGAVAGCASLPAALSRLIQPPTFDRDPERTAEVVILGPTREDPLGAAGVRLWARVRNPNGFGLTLSTLEGDLFLDDRRAARVDFPLGLPLVAGEESSIPLEFTIGLRDIPGLGGVIGRAALGSSVRYRLDGSVGVDAGPFGRPTFGPMPLLEGDARLSRRGGWDAVLPRERGQP